MKFDDVAAAHREREEEQTMLTTDNEAIVGQAVDAFNRGDLDAVDALFADDYVDHDRYRAGLPAGPAGVKQAWQMVRSAFPDLQATIADLVAAGDKVAVRGVIHGTHGGELMGIPATGREVTITLIDVNRIAGGRLVERWAEADNFGLLQQLGAFPGAERRQVGADTMGGVANRNLAQSTEASKAVSLRFIGEVINQGHFDAIDDLVAASYVYHGPGMDVRGPEGIRGVLAMLRTAFPDWHETLEDLIAVDGRVVFRVTGQGTHNGAFFGIPPTGTRVTMGGLDLVHVEGGKLVEHWANFDQLGLMQQLGAIPAPAGAS
jgi:steroid delta-isomerase-like uncharacterized protein